MVLAFGFGGDFGFFLFFGFFGASTPFSRRQSLRAFPDLVLQDSFAACSMSQRVGLGAALQSGGGSRVSRQSRLLVPRRSAQAAIASARARQRTGSRASAQSLVDESICALTEVAIQRRQIIDRRAKPVKNMTFFIVVCRLRA